VSVPKYQNSGIFQIAEKSRKSIENPDMGAIKVNVSIGCATKNGLSNNIEEDLMGIIHVADERLCKAKKNGKNMVAFA
jgi:GGDEF domain-containing protein